MLLRLATRGSRLGLWQAERVAALLRAARPDLEVRLVPVSTTGDRRAEVPVWEMGGQGVFVREVQACVMEGGADAAVHSAKDLQPVPTTGLVLAAFPERADPRDVLVGCRLADLRPGAPVATGSQRRRAQLAALRPDLEFSSLRGNIGTRLGKIPEGGAIVVAAAALARLDLRPEPAETLGTDLMLPQVGQGALAVECRAGDAGAISLLAEIDDPAVRAEVLAERAFLSRLGGGCELPVAGHAVALTGGAVRLEGLIASLDGKAVVRATSAGRPGAEEQLGREVADAVLGQGGRELLLERGA